MSKDTIMQMFKDWYEKEETNKNEFSYWFGKIKNTKGFKIPKTQIIKLPFDVYIATLEYTEENVKTVNEYLIAHLDEWFKQRKIFIKTGLFSNKFCFKWCDIEKEDIENNIGANLLNIQNGALCVGCPCSNEVVIREFIETWDERESIYFGMKLNTEFRVFYDFDSKKVIDIINYWERDYVGKSLYGEDKIKFEKSIDDIEKDFNELKDILQAKVETSLKENNELKGIWSIDFMYDSKNFWLIDMGIGKDSAYYNRIADKVKGE